MSALGARLRPVQRPARAERRRKKTKKTGAVPLAGGRGVRTVVHTFPVADAGGGAPTVRDDCVTLTPIVVRPRPTGPQSESVCKKLRRASAARWTPPEGLFAFRRRNPRSRATRGGPPSRASRRTIQKEHAFGRRTPSRAATGAPSRPRVRRRGECPGPPRRRRTRWAFRAWAVRGALVRGEDDNLAGRADDSVEDVVARRRAGSAPRSSVARRSSTWRRSRTPPRTRGGGSARCAAPRGGEGRLAVVVHLAPAARWRRARRTRAGWRRAARFASSAARGRTRSTGRAT